MVMLLQEKGYQIHYASDFNNPVYEFDAEFLKQEGIVLHQITLHKKPWHLIKNTKGLIQLSRIIKKENIKRVLQMIPRLLRRLCILSDMMKNITKVLYIKLIILGA